MMLDDRPPPRRCSASTPQLGLKVFMCFILAWVMWGVLLADIVTLPMPLDLCVKMGAGTVFGCFGFWLSGIIKRRFHR
jgi:hypothetical protein